MNPISTFNLKHIRKEQLPYMCFENFDVLPEETSRNGREGLLCNAEKVSKFVEIIFQVKSENNS